MMMMRIKVPFLALCVLMMLGMLSSCERIDYPDELGDGKVVKNGAGDPDGNLKVVVWEMATTPFDTFTEEANNPSTRATEAVSSWCTRLNFAIYTLDGTRVKQVNQTSDDPSFGAATFQLEPGNYMVVVVAHSSNGNPTMTDPTCIKFTNSQGFTETRIDCEKVVVTEEKQEILVSPHRIVSRCSFVLTDETIPSDVKTMRFYYTGGSGAFDATTGLGSVNSKQDVKFNVTADQKQFDLYTFLHDTEGTIHLTVTGLDASGNELYSRSFDVSMEQDHITWLTGAFFVGSGSSSLTITTVLVNTDWAGEKHLTF